MPLPAMHHDLKIVDLGKLPYAAALVKQVEVHQAVLSARESGCPCMGTLLFVEHVPPVITISRRPDARRHLTATPDMLARAGVEVCETDRGGDITYHGPGQLVAYPIIDLNAAGLNLHAYMRLLEEDVIAALARFGVKGEREPGATGVWVGGSKICAIGVRIRRWISMHGLALNVTTNLEHFDLIVPCGLAGRGVTSLERLLGPRCPSMTEVKGALGEEFARSLGATPVSGPPAHPR